MPQNRQVGRLVAHGAFTLLERQNGGGDEVLDTVDYGADPRP